MLRVTEASTDMKSSIDGLTEKLLRQIDHARGKQRKDWHPRDNGNQPGGSMSVPDEGESAEQIVKVKQFAVKPMNAEEAVLQLELIGHDFFVFRSDESGDINVVYRRKNGGYGLIEPSG
jgi:putative sigma-54 modulation protein